MSVSEVVLQRGGPTRLNPNWIEECLRREEKTIEGLWASTFAESFRSFLKCHDVQRDGPVAPLNGLSSFGRYVITEFALTDMRTVSIDLQDFRDYCERESARRWVERHSRVPEGCSGSADIPPMPSPSPFTDAALFLEYFFTRLEGSVKGMICEYFKSVIAPIGRGRRPAADQPATGDAGDQPTASDSAARATDPLSETNALEYFGVTNEKLTKLLALNKKRDSANCFMIMPKNPSLVLGVRALRSNDAGHLIGLKGVVTRVSDVKPELRAAHFECMACKSQTQIPVEQNYKFTEPTHCHRQNCGNRTKWILKLEESIFADWQKLRLQQSASGQNTFCTCPPSNRQNCNCGKISPDEDVPAGTVPRVIDVIARGPAVEKCKPGDHVIVIGHLVAVPDVPTLAKRNEIQADLRSAKNQSQDTSTLDSESALKGINKLGVRELMHKLVFIAVNIVVNQPGSGTEDHGGPPLIPGSTGGRLVRQLIQLETPQLSDTGAEDVDMGEESTAAKREFLELCNHPLLRPLALTPDEHSRFRKIARSFNFLDRLIRFVTPNIYGCDDLKKGVLLMLVGGVEKRTRKDSIKLRGDINVCIIGDPGTAKSQVLQFVQGFADRSILTSGKGSSAAGLTASVHKDPEQGESVVEAGALILADQGICCIDEFDRMEDRDMVAIHEAMEQQTISISKAGVQATMNARAAVLAACNPVNGKIQTEKSMRENVRLSAAIMSRFDLVFILLDRPDEEHDERIARHVLSYIRGGHIAEPAEAATGLKSVGELKKYVTIAKCFRPQISPEARRTLVKEYVQIRQRDSLVGSRSSRITVRQLEAMLRVSEAIAKLAFSDFVTERHAQLAVNLFINSSTRSRREKTYLSGQERDGMEEVPRLRDGYHIDSDLLAIIQNLTVGRLQELKRDEIVAQTVPAQRARMEQLKENRTRKKVTEWFLAGDFSEGHLSSEEESERFNLIIDRMIHNGLLFETSHPNGLVLLDLHPNVESASSKVVGSAKDSQSEVNIDLSSLPAHAEGALAMDNDEFLSLLYRDE